MGLKPILLTSVPRVNAKATICVPNIAEESTSLDFDDLLENIKLLLDYIIKHRKKNKNTWLNKLANFPILINDPSMDITRELVIKILKYLHQHQDFYFPFIVVNKEYTEEDDDFVELEPNEWQMIEEDDKYQTFQLWENLQNLDEPTLAFMAKGFIEEINNG